MPGGNVSVSKGYARPIDITQPYQQRAHREGLDYLDPDTYESLPQFDAGQFPGLNSLQGGSLGNLEAMSQELAAGVGDQAQGYSNAQDALNLILSKAGGGVDEGFDDFFRTSVYDPAIRDFQQGFLEDTSRNAAQTGNIYGDNSYSDRGREDLLRSLTEQRAGLAQEVSEGNKDRAAGALGLSGDVFGASQAAQESYFDVGERARAVEQQEYEALYAEFQRMMDEVYRRTGLFMQGATATTRGVGQFSESTSLGLS